jgi:hypothetical protein
MDDCISYLCDRKARTPGGLCRECDACVQLTVPVRQALDRFINGNIPLPSADADSTVEFTVRAAGEDIARGLWRLLELLQGKRIYALSNIYPEHHADAWHISVGAWDISETQGELTH